MKRLFVAVMWAVSLSMTGVVGFGGHALAARVLSSDPCVPIGLPVVAGIGTAGCPAGQISNDPKTGGAIINYLRGWLVLLSGAVGLVIVLMIIISGIQYITSVGDPGAIKSAKSRLTNAIIALVLFLSMYAILGFLIPGGIL